MYPRKSAVCSCSGRKKCRMHVVEYCSKCRDAWASGMPCACGKGLTLKSAIKIVCDWVYETESGEIYDNGDPLLSAAVSLLKTEVGDGGE